MTILKRVNLENDKSEKEHLKKDISEKENPRKDNYEKGKSEPPKINIWEMIIMTEWI